MNSIKKYLILFLLFSFAAIIYLLYPFNSKEHFVFIKDNKFILNGKDFYPIAVNYKVSMGGDKNELWPCPFFGYTPDAMSSPATKDSCLMQLRADMELIREMGFNSVRIVGIGEADVNKKTGEITIVARTGKQSDTTVSLLSEDSYKYYFTALSKMFKIVNEAGLKIVFLIRLDFEGESSDNHLRIVSSHYKNDTSIMAYDLFNEPLYFDSVWDRTKQDAVQITKRWNKILKMYAPNQLSTIGLANLREVFRWDPNLLDVDFISFHPYNHEPEQVMNELYWYGQYVKKPWILGETAISADNDSITYEEQKNFAEKTLKQTYNCGAIGYSWWQYKDVDWKKYRDNFTGVVSRKGETRTAKENLLVQGTPKPVADAFKKFDPSGKKDSCVRPANYYNYSQCKTMRMIGQLTDMNNIPIVGGVVLAWDQWWVYSCHTITKPDGSFELLGSRPFYHWIASATLYSTVYADISPDTAKKYADTIPTLNIGTIKLQKVELED